MLELTRIWVTVGAALILVIDLELSSHYHRWITSGGFFSRLLEICFVGPIVILVQTWSPFKGGFKNMLRGAGQRLSVTITHDEVVLESRGFAKRFSTREILRAEEPKWGFGLYLRTANRYRWLPIPKTIEGYSEAKNEIHSLGIPVVETIFLPNWEEFVGVGLFCASLLFDLICTSRSWLLANLVIAILLGIGGWYVVNSGSNDDKTKRLARIGGLIPVISAAVAFYFAR
jgi:hypothetical protein